MLKLASGYQQRGDGRLPMGQLVDSEFVGADGSLLCTLGDLGAWASALAQRQFLSKELWELTCSPIARIPGGSKSLSYGLGWYVDESRHGRIVFHSGGSMIGCRTVLMRFLKHDLTFILLANENLLNVDTLALSIDDVYLNRPSGSLDTKR